MPLIELCLASSQCPRAQHRDRHSLGQLLCSSAELAQAQVIQLSPSTFCHSHSECFSSLFPNVRTVNNKKPSSVQQCKSERRNAPLEKPFQKEQTLSSCGSCGAAQPGEPGAEQLPHTSCTGEQPPPVPPPGCQACPGARQEMLALYRRNLQCCTREEGRCMPAAPF